MRYHAESSFQSTRDSIDFTFSKCYPCSRLTLSPIFPVAHILVIFGLIWRDARSVTSVRLPKHLTLLGLSGVVFSELPPRLHPGTTQKAVNEES
jgi:hypothetical protein